MPNDNVELILMAYEAYARGDLGTMLGFVDQDLEWTYLDPSHEDPEPQVCHGRHELQEALERRAKRGLTSELEEVAGNGAQVMVVARTPGVDAHRVRPADDRNFTVFTVRDGRISPFGTATTGRKRWWSRVSSSNHGPKTHSRRESAMSEQTMALAREGFDAWQRGDFAFLEAMLDPDVQWRWFEPESATATAARTSCARSGSATTKATPPATSSSWTPERTP